MALARSRAAARRVKDRWKAKQWYRVTAPPSFNNNLLAETLADEPDKLPGRRVEVTLNEMTGDMRQMHIKLYFRVNEVIDNQAKTSYDGHTMTSDYVRRLTRRGASKISAVFDVKTKDGSRLRLKPFAITDRRAQTTQGQTIRQIMTDMLTDTAAKNNLPMFLKELLVGDLTNAIYKEARKVHPLRRIEVAKVEVLKAPTIEVDETPIILPEPEPADEEGEEGEAVELDATEDSEAESVEAVADSADEEE